MGLLITPDDVHAFSDGMPVVVPAGQSFYTKERTRTTAIASLQLTNLSRRVTRTRL